MTTYKVTLSSGNRRDIRATSAADAIQTALEKNLGETVTACFSGDEHGAKIIFDIPAHKPVTAVPTQLRHGIQKPVRVRCTDPDHPSNKPADWLADWVKEKVTQ